MPTPGVLTLNYAYVWAGIRALPAKSIYGLMYANSQNVNKITT
jgi:hypothetical protein